MGTDQIETVVQPSEEELQTGALATPEQQTPDKMKFKIREASVQVMAERLVTDITETVTGWPEWQQAVMKMVRERGQFPPHQKLFFQKGNQEVVVTLGHFGGQGIDKYVDVRMRPINKPGRLTDTEREDAMITGFIPDDYFDTLAQAHYVNKDADSKGGWNRSEIRFFSPQVFEGTQYDDGSKKQTMTTNTLAALNGVREVAAQLKAMSSTQPTVTPSGM